MNKILIIGCTDTTKILVPALIKNKDLVDELCIASKTKEECDEYRRKYQGSPVRIITAGIDVTNEEKTLLMMNIFGPTLIINLAPSYLNRTIMEIAVKVGASYLDTAYYTDETGTQCLIEKQFELSNEFYSKGLKCVTGCSFNPSAYVCLAKAILKERLLDQVDSVDLIRIDSFKSDAGDALPSIGDLMKLHVDGRSIENGEYKSFDALCLKTTRTFPGMGKRTLYAFDNSVIDSFKHELPDIKNVRYFSSIKKQHVTILNALNKVGMLSEKEIFIKGAKISPVEYLEAIMPKTNEAHTSSKGTVNIGLLATGLKNGENKSVLLYLMCDQSESYAEHGVSAVSLMTAMTTLAGVRLLEKGKWNNPGVFTPGDYEPELLLDKMKELGIEYKVQEDAEPMVVEEVVEEQDE